MITFDVFEFFSVIGEINLLFTGDTNVSPPGLHVGPVFGVN